MPSFFLPEEEDGLLNNTIDSLDVGRSKFAEKEIEKLGRLLVKNNSLEAISACECCLNDKLAEKLADVLKNHSIKYLALQCNFISDNGILALIEIPSLEYLNLSSNRVTDCAADQILENKKLSETLEFLDLSYNSEISEENLFKLMNKFRNSYSSSPPSP